MARESKAKRDERRFGKPERLADLLVSVPVEKWKIPPWINDLRGLENQRRVVDLVRESLPRTPILEITNVSDYWFAQPGERCEVRDFPSCTPPFDFCFVEYSPRLDVPNLPKRFGWFCITQDCSNDKPSLFTPKIINSRWQIDALLFLQDVNGNVAYTGYREGWGIDEDGNLIPDSYGFCQATSISDEDRDAFGDYYKPMIFPLFLAFSFANCKNVLIKKNEPDPAFNRERKKAGMKPFLRYHTINIEPMKRVLKAEGNVESEGLKRALHIVRGHFMRYTPERPLFGKHAGTFWAPAHIRGEIKQGVVVSDYAVRAPGTSASSASNRSTPSGVQDGPATPLPGADAHDRNGDSRG